MRNKFFILTMIAIMIISMFIFVRRNETKFTVNKWNNNIYNREKILDDFLSTYKLYSMSFDEVLTLLGNNGIVQGSKITYIIGKSYVGPVLFNISFDENNNVISFGKIAD